MTTDDPLVSVIIPTHNRPELLKRAVSSVLGQTYNNLELLVIDDASDERADLESTFDFDSITAFEYIYLEENRGGAGARNVGMERAMGEYVAFLDDDDEWLPRKVERQLECFESVGEDVGLVYTAVVQRNDKKGIEEVHFNPVPEDHRKQLLLKQYIGTMSSVMVRSEVLGKVDGLNEAFPCWHDWDFYFRVSNNCKFAAVEEPLVRQYAGIHEQISDDFETKRGVSTMLVNETFEEAIEEYGVRREVKARQRKQLAHSAYRSGETLVALYLLIRGTVLQPSLSGCKYIVLYAGGEKIRRRLR